MKKILKIFLAFAMVFSTLQLQKVEAVDVEGYSATLKSFVLKNYQDIYEITGGTQLPLEYEIESNIPEDTYPEYNLTAFFKNSDGSLATLSIIDNVLFTFEEQRYFYNELDFLFIRFSVVYEGNWYNEYYSPYTLENILNVVNNSPKTDDYGMYCPDLNDTTYNYIDIQPFKIKFTDYHEVNKPDITSISVSQDGTKIDLTFTTSEIKKGDFTSFYIFLQRYVENGGYSDFQVGFHSIIYLGIIDGKPTYTASSTIEYENNNLSYGDYSVYSYAWWDVAIQDFYGDSSNISNLNEVKVTYDKNMNLLEKINPDDVYAIETVYRAEEDLYAGVSLVWDYNGRKIDIQNFSCFNENGEYINSVFEGLNIDTTKPQTVKRTLLIEIRASLETVFRFEKEVSVRIIPENGLGTIVDFEKDFEICAKREDVINENGEFDIFNFPFKAPALLNDGTYGEGDVEFGYGNQIIIHDEDCPYGWVSGMFFPTIEYNPHKLELVYRIYMQDDDGNLVDSNGNIIVKYENRKDIVHESNNTAVSVTSLEGSVPTYTTVNAVEEDVDDVFDGESIAYDITLNAVNNAVQPVDNVEVSIDLPENLKDKEVEVYYVDDEGNTELLESTSNGESVTFNTDHFSTYAVVEKKADDTTTPDDGNDDTTEPNNPTDDTNKEDNTKPEDTNKDDKLEDTTDKEETTKPEDNKEDKVEETNKPTESKPNTPQTGDNSNVEFYTSLLFVSMMILAFVLLKNRKQA